MPVSQQGAINLTALLVPDTYIQIVPPSISYLNGVPTNLVGMVGVASWGPVNVPQFFGDAPAAARLFGPVTVRRYDLVTAFSIAVLQGAQNFVGVRVSDGTDQKALAGVSASAAKQAARAVPVAAGTGYAVNDTINIAGGTSTTVAVLKVTGIGAGGAITAAMVQTAGAYTVLPANPVAQASTSGSGTGATFNMVFVPVTADITYTALYSGVMGNGVQITHAAGSRPNTSKVTVGIAGQLPEQYDNIPGTGATLWANVAAAINTGLPGVRSASQIVSAVAGGGTGALVAASFNLAGGTDGSAGVTPSIIVGTDGSGGARTGMYALRGSKASIAGLPDVDDSTTWTLQDAFGLSEGIYMQTCTPAGSTIAASITAKNTAGLADYSTKLIHGDWPTFNDTVNGQLRLVSPIAYACGRLGNLAPQNSSLNKQLAAVVATQQQQTGNPYSSADLAQLAAANIDVIANPCPGGSYFGFRLGLNTSPLQSQQEDSYTRLTNYIAYTLASGMGQFVGQNQTPDLREDARAVLNAFLQGMLDAGMIGTADGSQAFKVTLDSSNNPPAKVAQGYMQADVQVTYLSVVRFFIVNLQGGQTVQVTVQPASN